MNKAILLIILFFSLNSELYSKSKKSFVPILFSPPHNINMSNGVSASYIFPGFFSQYGQLNLNYTNSQKDTYFMGLGAMFVLAGLNKNIVDNNVFGIYSNLSIGYAFEGYLGDLGISAIKKINNDESMVLSLDAYLHQGYNGLPILGYVTYRRGIAGMLDYTIRFSKKAVFKFSAGVSFIQYRYMCDYDGINCDSILYVTYSKEKSNIDYLKSPSWENHFVFPLGITLCYSLN